MEARGVSEREVGCEMLFNFVFVVYYGKTTLPSRSNGVPS